MQLKWNMEANDRNDVKLKHESFTEQRRQFVDYHIYCDIDYVDEIFLDTITRKVVVLDKYTDFKKQLDSSPKPPEMGMFYGELFVSASPLRFDYVSKGQFRENQMEHIREHQQRATQQIAVQQRTANLRVSIGPTVAPKLYHETRKKSEDIPILERIKLGIDDSDSSDSDDHDDSSGSPETEPEANGLKQNRKIKRRTDRKQIAEENKDRISSEDMATMNTICDRLHLPKGPNIGSRLYHFTSHLAAYQCLDELFKQHTEQSFAGFVQRQRQSWCRDVKYALYTRGQIVPLTVMKENISKRFNELKPLYNAATESTINSKKRSGQSAGNEPARKKQRISWIDLCQSVCGLPDH